MRKQIIVDSDPVTVKDRPIAGSCKQNFYEQETRISENFNNSGWIAIDEYSIKAIAYQPELFKLLISFKSGDIYGFSSVIQTTFENFVAAKSKSSFYILHISGKYSCSLINKAIS